MLNRLVTPLALLLWLSACGEPRPSGEGEIPGSLDSSKAQDPVAQSAPAAGEPLVGEFRYMADAALFRLCGADRGWPVSGPAYLELERAYLEIRPGPGEPILAVLSGETVQQPRMEGDGTESALAVEEVLQLYPNLSCPDLQTGPPERVAGWVLVHLPGMSRSLSNEGELPSLNFEPPLGQAGGPNGPEEPAEGTVEGFNGCNRFRFSYEANRTGIRFGIGPMTLMACPDTDEVEPGFMAALDAARDFRAEDGILRLLGSTGILAVFIARQPD